MTVTKWKEARNPITSPANLNKPCNLSSCSSSSQLSGLNNLPTIFYDRAGILEELNYLYEWNDSTQSRPYFNFTAARLDTDALSFLTAFFACTMIPWACLSIQQDFEFQERVDDQNMNFLLFLSSFALLTLACFVLSLGGRLWLSQRVTQRFKLSDQKKFILHHWYIVGIHLFVIVSFLRNALGHRSTLSGVIDSHRNVYLDQGSLITMFATPVLLFSTFLQTRLEVIWIMYGLILLAYLVVILQMQIFADLPVVAAWVVGGVFLITDLHVRSIGVYLSTNKLKETIAENERMAEQIHANEMRSMIGNVAHDLKTPLSSFTTGIDYIQMILGDFQSHLQNGEIIPKTLLQDSIASIHSCLVNVRNTNAFMLMTINRCIDYTKASKGLKLIPRYETIDLRETLDLPLQCMRNIQHRIEIKLNTLPTEICSHIITDKQWLQENALCLLSNAVKYSAGGCVTISLSLETRPVMASAKLQPPTASISRTRSETTASLRSKPSRVIPTDFNGDNNKPGQFAHLVSSSMIRVHTHGKQISDVSDAGIAPEPDFVSPEIMQTKSNDSIRIQKEEQVLRVEIEDMGIGISDEAMATLFNPFKQTQRLAGGTGLGLYSLAKRVEALKGTYGVQHRKDGKQGTLFWFSIPYRADVVTADAVRSIEKTLAPPPSVQEMAVLDLSETDKDDLKDLPASFASDLTELIKEKETPQTDHSNVWDILIVDDSPAILKMTSMMLKKLGHSIDTAENGEVAVKAIEHRWQQSKKSYDLILMDLQMPVMDGLEATRRIRLLEQHLSEKVVTNVVASRPSLLTVAISNSKLFTSLKRLPSAMLIGATTGANTPSAPVKSLYRTTVEEDNEEDATNNTNASTVDNKSEPVDSKPRFPRQVIIGLSANSDHETTGEAYRAGVDTFLSKPFNLFTFHETLQTLNISKRCN